MTIRNYICAVGIILTVACYFEQIITITETGKSSKIWTVLMWALAVATAVEMLASAGVLPC